MLLVEEQDSWQTTIKSVLKELRWGSADNHLGELDESDSLFIFAEIFCGYKLKL